MERESDEKSEQYKLARERTRLSRERTTLAHIRTGFASFLFGVAIVGIYGEVGHLLGAVFVGIGVLFVLTSGVSLFDEQKTHEPDPESTGTTALSGVKRRDYIFGRLWQRIWQG